MTRIEDKIGNLVEQQNKLKTLELGMKFEQGVYEEKLKEVLIELGFKEGEQVPLAELVEKAIKKSKEA